MTPLFIEYGMSCPLSKIYVIGVQLWFKRCLDVFWIFSFVAIEPKRHQRCLLGLKLKRDKYLKLMAYLSKN